MDTTDVDWFTLGAAFFIHTNWANKAWRAIFVIIIALSYDLERDVAIWALIRMVWQVIVPTIGNASFRIIAHYVPLKSVLLRPLFIGFDLSTLSPFSFVTITCVVSLVSTTILEPVDRENVIVRVNRSFRLA